MSEISDKQKSIRQVQLVQKEILMDVVSVCENNGLSYFLSSGTLLGAVRHGGFIPWDDDVDIDIPIRDYRRFLEIAQDCLGDKYFVQTSMTDPNFSFAYTRIRKNNTTFLDEYHRSYRIHHGVWIDVFPQVPVQPGWKLSILRKWISLSNFVQSENRIVSHREEYEGMLGAVGMRAVMLFSKLPMKTRQKIHNAMLDRVFNADPDKCSHVTNVWGNITTIFPKEIYDGEASRVGFEGLSLRAPHDYIRYLEVKYGDYMQLPPVEQRYGHGKSVIIDLDHSFEQYMTDPEG